MGKLIKGFFFDKRGNLQRQKKDDVPLKIEGMSIKSDEDVFKQEGRIDKHRIVLINKYSKKYPELSIEQISELIDHPDLKLGEKYVINKILKK